MKSSHVEIIQPIEKLSGYNDPTRPATMAELSRAVRAGHLVFKVLKSSVNWTRYAKTRRLQMPECQIKVAVIGAIRMWYFVQVLE